VARIFPAKDLISETMKIAEKIASFSRPAGMLRPQYSHKNLSHHEPFAPG